MLKNYIPMKSLIHFSLYVWISCSLTCAINGNPSKQNVPLMTDASVTRQTSSFTINPIYDSTVRKETKQVISSVINELQSIVKAPDIVLTINISTPVIDGSGKVLASAGPRLITQVNGFVMPVLAVLRLDIADVNRLLQMNALNNVVKHELMHCMGFGILWTYNNVYISDSGRYTGRFGIEGHNQVCPSASFVDVQLDGSAGNINSHWDETKYENELMTPYIQEQNPAQTRFSKISVYSLQDIGYQIDRSSPFIGNYNCPVSGLLRAQEGINTTDRHQFEILHPTHFLTPTGNIVPLG